MKKSAKKRGRPGIKPHIERLIASRVLEEKRKPAEARMPIKVLAFEIHKTISQQVDEPPPALSTLEKRISQHGKRSSPLDEPWSLASLVQYPIGPEALPSVLMVWASQQEGTDLEFSIRQALWVARLYAAVDDCHTLAALSLRLSMLESVHESLGKPFYFHEWYDSKWEALLILSLHREPELTLSEQKAILRVSDEEWRKLQHTVGEKLKIGRKLDLRDAWRSLHPTRYRSLVKETPERRQNEE